MKNTTESNKRLEESIEEIRVNLKSRIIEILSDTNISSTLQIDMIEKDINNSRCQIHRLL